MLPEKFSITVRMKEKSYRDISIPTMDTGILSRAVFPLFNLLHPSLNAQIQEGMVNTFNESGWLPEWASPGHRNCMVGSNPLPL